MRILFSPYGGGSIAHIIRSLAIADALRARGHEVLFTAPTKKKHLIENAGYQVFGAGHAEVNLNDEHDQSITYFRKNHDRFLDWLGDEIKAAETFQPHIIVNSPTFFGPLASHKTGIPHISIINAQWLTEFRGLLGLSKSRKRHYVMRRIAAPIFAKRFEALYLEEIRTFYQKLEVPYLPKRRVDLHKHNPILIPGIPEFEPIQRTGRTNIHYVGPLFWQGFEKETFEPQEIFPDFGHKPFIYASLGGSIYRKESYQDLVNALAQHPEWNVLLSLGPNFSPEEFGKQPSHLAIRPFVPGLQACEFADLIINTAGHGTVMQALWYGKPIIALPHNIDQATIAARLSELGAGINLNQIGIRDFSDQGSYFKRATKTSWEMVIASASKALKTPRLYRKARLLQAQLHAYGDGAERAANYTEQYARPDDH